MPLLALSKLFIFCNISVTLGLFYEMEIFKWVTHSPMPQLYIGVGIRHTN